MTVFGVMGRKTDGEMPIGVMGFKNKLCATATPQWGRRSNILSKDGYGCWKVPEAVVGIISKNKHPREAKNGATPSLFFLKPFHDHIIA